MTQTSPPAFHAMDSTITRAPDASGQIAAALLDYIVANRLPAGSRIPSERELAERFGVSRTVIRQATRALIGKGVLESHPGVGVVVVPVSSAAVVTSIKLYLQGQSVPYEWVHEIRMTIEVEIAGLAAARGTTEQIERLRQLHAEIVAHDGRKDYEARSVAGVAFHRHLALMAGNDLFLLLLDAIGDILLEVRRTTAAQVGPGQDIVHHENILSAIASHDPPAARQAMATHLTRAYEDWRKHGQPVDLTHLSPP